MKKDTAPHAWLDDARFDEMIGRPAAIRCAVLRMDITGQGRLVDIARRFKLSKQAITRHAARVRELFPPHVRK